MQGWERTLPLPLVVRDSEMRDWERSLPLSLVARLADASVGTNPPLAPPYEGGDSDAPVARLRMSTLTPGPFQSGELSRGCRLSAIGCRREEGWKAVGFRLSAIRSRREGS